MIERMPLSEEEIRVIEMLDRAGLLHDMDKEHFRGKEDVAVIFCNDGRWALRVIDRFREMYDETNMICVLPLNEFGGTLVLDDNSPLLEKKADCFSRGNGDDLHFMRKIRIAAGMGYRAFCNINHFPCGMGRKYKIPPLHIVDSLMMAKRRIKSDPGIGTITIANFLQIGESNGAARIARIPTEDYLLWRKENSEGASPSMRDMLASLL